ncbi:MAG TPA: hypothetical protein PLQ36_00815 [Candidatus Gracilibacteria bacterium]|nr:hypothetical protein [Candidatus Gracilibacteria bacterium]
MENSPKPIVLLHEKDDGHKMVIEHILSDLDCEILSTNSFPEAQEIIQNIGNKIVLLISNVGLCSVDNGFSLAEQLKTQNPDAKVVLISGLHHHEKLEDTDIEAFYTKPLSFQSFCKEIDEIIHPKI